MDIIRRQVAKFGLDQMKNFMVNTLLPQFPRYSKMQDNLLTSFQRNQFIKFKRLRGGNDSDPEPQKKTEYTLVRKNLKRKCVSDENFEIPCSSLSSFEGLVKCSQNSCEIIVNDKVLSTVSKDISNPADSETTKKSNKEIPQSTKRRSTSKSTTNTLNKKKLKDGSDQKLIEEPLSSDNLNPQSTKRRSRSKSIINTLNKKKLKDGSDQKLIEEPLSSENLNGNDKSYPLITSLLTIILNLTASNEILTEMLKKKNCETSESFDDISKNDMKSLEQQNLSVSNIDKFTQYESLPLEDLPRSNKIGSQKNSNTEFDNNRSISEESAGAKYNQQDFEKISTNSKNVKSTRRYPTKANIKDIMNAQEKRPTLRHTPTNHSKSYRSLDDHFTQTNEFNRFPTGTYFDTNTPNCSYFFARDGSFNHHSNINEMRNYRHISENVPVNRNNFQYIEPRVFNNRSTQEETFLPQRVDYINLNLNTPHITTNDYEAFPMVNLECLYSNNFNHYNNNGNYQQ